MADMIAHYRYRHGEREAIAHAGEATSVLAKLTPSQQAWGRVTSRRPAPFSAADIAFMAFRTGVKPAILRRAFELGLFRDG